MSVSNDSMMEHGSVWSTGISNLRERDAVKMNLVDAIAP